MNILLANDFIDNRGGAEKNFHDHHHLLEKHGHTVTVLKPPVNEGFASYINRWFSISMYNQTKRLITEKNIDLLHVHSCTRNISPSPIVAAKKKGIPVVMTTHDYQYICPKTWAMKKDRTPCDGYSISCIWQCQSAKESPRYLPFHTLKWAKVGLHRKIVRKNVDVFTPPSSELCRRLQQTFKLPDDRVLHLPYFIPNHQLKKTPPMPSIKPEFIYIGRISKEKGIDIAIKAIHTLAQTKKYPDLTFKIIGNGPYRPILENLAKTLGIEKHIQFFARIDNNLLAPYFYNSLAVIMPSLWMENSPLVAYEAMQYSTPIIASDIGGYPDLINDRKTGFLFPIYNDQELASHMQTLLDNPQMRIEIGKAGRKKLENELSEDQYYRKIQKLYARLTN